MSIIALSQNKKHCNKRKTTVLWGKISHFEAAFPWWLWWENVNRLKWTKHSALFQQDVVTEASLKWQVIHTHTCLGRWNKLFLRNMFLAWLQVPSMMITLCFTAPTSWCSTKSSRFWDLGPGYRISVRLSRHTAASSGFLRGKIKCIRRNPWHRRCDIGVVKSAQRTRTPAYFSSVNLLPTMTLHFPCGKQAARSGTVRRTLLSWEHTRGENEEPLMETVVTKWPVCILLWVKVWDTQRGILHPGKAKKHICVNAGFVK